MNFDYTDEQQLLKDSFEGLLADRYSFDKRATYATRAEGWSRELWAQYADVGVLGIPFSEADGGLAGNSIDTSIVMEALGHALALEPYLATVVIAGGLLRYAGDAPIRRWLVPQIASGKLTLAFAHSERHARYDLAHVATTARRDGDSWILNGEKSLVLHGDCADRLIVSARSTGAERDRRGIGLFLIEANAPGVARVGYPTQDGLRAAEISLRDVQVHAAGVLGDATAALPIIERVVDEAIAALCAEAVGAMSITHALTVDYLKTRRQFGRVIGSFQALQHQAVDMYVALEQARSMTFFATMMLGAGDEIERRRAIAAAKLQVGRAARLVGQKAIQLHGGIGMTFECRVSHYFKRLTMIDYLFGNSDHHLTELARLGGLFRPREDAA